MRAISSRHCMLVKKAVFFLVLYAATSWRVSDGRHRSGGKTATIVPPFDSVPVVVVLRVSAVSSPQLLLPRKFGGVAEGTLLPTTGPLSFLSARGKRRQGRSKRGRGGDDSDEEEDDDDDGGGRERGEDDEGASGQEPDEHEGDPPEGADDDDEGSGGGESQDEEGEEDEGKAKRGKGKNGKTTQSAASSDALEYDKFVAAAKNPAMLEPELAYGSGAELCSSMKCAKVGSGAPSNKAVKGCKRVVRCKDCNSTGTAVGSEETCASWKVAAGEVVLADGWLASGQTIPAGGSLVVDFTWKSEDILDFSSCAPDLKQLVNGLAEVKKKGDVAKFPLFVPVAFTYTRSQPSEGEKKNKQKATNIPAAFQFDDAVGRSPTAQYGGVSAGAPMCSSNTTHIPGSTLRGAETEFAVLWISVPSSSSGQITPRHFKLTLKCGNQKSCELGRQAVCARISCRPVNADLLQRRDALTAAMLSPIAEGGGPHTSSSSASGTAAAATMSMVANSGSGGGGGAVNSHLVASLNLDGVSYVGTPLPEVDYFIQQIPHHQLMAQYYNLRHWGAAAATIAHRCGVFVVVFVVVLVSYNADFP